MEKNLPEKQVKLSVLLAPDVARAFDYYCSENGYKKSTLIARLIRQHLDREASVDLRSPEVRTQETE